MFFLCRVWAAVRYWSWTLPHGNWGSVWYAIHYYHFFNPAGAQALADKWFPEVRNA
jgi:hypothetical protein